MIEKLDQIEPRVLRLGVYCCLVLVIAGLVTRSIGPDYASYVKLVDAHTVLEQAAANESGVGGEITQIQTQVDELRMQVAGDMANLPEQQMESFIVERLQAISWRHDIELGSLTPSAGLRTEQYNEMLFQVELNGSYFALVNWLGDLSDELGFVVVREQQMTMRQSGARKPQLIARLSLAAYRLAGLE